MPGRKNSLESQKGEDDGVFTKGGSISEWPGASPVRENFAENPAKSGLNAFERECINLFVHAAQVLSVPRSIGEIYGLLYASGEPLTMEDIIDRLAISKGSASQGLRWLRDINAVRMIYVAGDRRDHFEAETELRKLAFGYLRETIEPHLSRGGDYLDRLDRAAAELPGDGSRKFAEGRRKKLRRWHRFASQMLPLFLRVAAKF